MTCPLCHRPTTWEGNPWRPFCCERCQVTDLGTWAAEQYRIPGLPLTAETGMRESLAPGEQDNEEREEAADDSSSH
ncbi:MAG: DNA gyrase inhibitor YacG [Nitrospira sp.]|nr:DNA gyrase inhibitor YacG [Nitrospira sp.]